jgi:hypothetical protein
MATDITNRVKESVASIAHVNGATFNDENVNISSVSTTFMPQHPVVGL